MSFSFFYFRYLGIKLKIVIRQEIANLPERIGELYVGRTDHIKIS
jgi:hypothetical protein